MCYVHLLLVLVREFLDCWLLVYIIYEMLICYFTTIFTKSSFSNLSKS